MLLFLSFGISIDLTLFLLSVHLLLYAVAFTIDGYFLFCHSLSKPARDYTIVFRIRNVCCSYWYAYVCIMANYTNNYNNCSVHSTYVVCILTGYGCCIKNVVTPIFINLYYRIRVIMVSHILLLFYSYCGSFVFL